MLVFTNESIFVSFVLCYYFVGAKNRFKWDFADVLLQDVNPQIDARIYRSIGKLHKYI